MYYQKLLFHINIFFLKKEKKKKKFKPPLITIKKSTINYENK